MPLVTPLTPNQPTALLLPCQSSISLALCPQVFCGGIPFLNLEQEAVYAEELKAGGGKKSADKSGHEASPVDPNS